MFVCKFGMLRKYMEWKIFEDKNNCLESADIWDLAVICHFNFIIDNFRDIYIYIYKRMDFEIQQENRRRE